MQSAYVPNQPTCLLQISTLKRSVTSSNSPISVSTPRRRHRAGFHIPRACQSDGYDTTVPEQCVKSSNERESLKWFEDFSLTLCGAYAGLQGVGSAYAVPEVLKETFKTKPASLLHPIAMWLVFGTAVYTFYLGFQSSKIRKTEGDEKKKLVKGKFGARHFKTSSLLFAVMTITTFEGMANTYTRTGKLFPGPHLYAGLGLVALFSVMSSLVPYMQKGEEWAKSVHFGFGVVCLGLFGWQAKSGLVIVGKLLGWS